MSSYNLVVLMGNLTRDIELSYTTNQVAVAQTGIAVNKKYKDKETVLFVDLVCFGKQAETLNKYTSKGSPLLISGELTLDQWEAKDGTKRSKHKVIVQSFQFLGDGQKKESQPETDKAPSSDGQYNEEMGF